MMADHSTKPKAGAAAGEPTISGVSPEDLPIIESPITYLEMTHSPGAAPVDLGAFTMQREEHPTVQAYLDIYRAVGRDYIWNYRPGQTVSEIAAIIQSPRTQLYLLRRGDEVVGMAELDVSKPRDVELVHFGLIPELLHQGIGRKFLQNIIHTAWSEGLDRLWLSTCGMDHPKAVRFYENAGFAVFKTTVGEFKDYRFSDFYTLSDAPQIPHGTKRAGPQS